MTLKPACVFYVLWKYVYVPCVAEEASERRLTGERRSVLTESPPLLLGLETTVLTDLGLVKVRLVKVELVRLATCWKTCQAGTQPNSALWFCDSSRHVLLTLGFDEFEKKMLFYCPLLSSLVPLPTCCWKWLCQGRWGPCLPLVRQNLKNSVMVMVMELVMWMVVVRMMMAICCNGKFVLHLMH